ncbi:MAG TPA: 5-(carboxyamino)imidazole ribonucleotide synthase [Candidatus Nitrosopolaris sp.]|nr:5-(carboxyamino)imidazole ribonucleotide synthase [Candidatus Nitrosopolaris sp.]
MKSGSLNELSSTKPLSIGIIGGGQLGKMIALEAKRMALKVCILDPSRCCPASSVSDELIVADFKDERAIRNLASKSDVVTYEIELANSEALIDLASKNCNFVNPSPETLKIIQDKYNQKSFLKENNLKVPTFALVNTEEQLNDLCEDYGLPVILKARQDSYDGRGNYLIRSRVDISKAFSHFIGENRQLMVEKFVNFKKEISIMVARNASGEITSFPVVENIHKNHILSLTIVPARVSDKVASNARKMAEQALIALKGAGIFGIEMFVTYDDKVMINEIAPRPHNSGHYSIEACSISQFEQHLRAILDLPLSEPRLLSPAVAMLNVLGPKNYIGPYAISGLRKLFSIPRLKLHIYGKQISKPQRKLGHITLLGDTLEEILLRIKMANKAIKVKVLNERQR